MGYGEGRGPGATGGLLRGARARNEGGAKEHMGSGGDAGARGCAWCAPGGRQGQAADGPDAALWRTAKRATRPCSRAVTDVSGWWRVEAGPRRRGRGRWRGGPAGPRRRGRRAHCGGGGWIPNRPPPSASARVTRWGGGSLGPPQGEADGQNLGDARVHGRRGACADLRGTAASQPGATAEPRHH